MRSLRVVLRFKVADPIPVYWVAFVVDGYLDAMGFFYNPTESRLESAYAQLCEDGGRSENVESCPVRKTSLKEMRRDMDRAVKLRGSARQLVDAYMAMEAL